MPRSPRSLLWVVQLREQVQVRAWGDSDIKMVASGILREHKLDLKAQLRDRQKARLAHKCSLSKEWSLPMEGNGHCALPTVH